MELPTYDDHGGSLVSFDRLDDASMGDRDAAEQADSSIIIVLWNRQVLLGLNVERKQWELPGGSIEQGESAHDAAVRELAEETGIQVNAVSLVAKIEFTFAGDTATYAGAVFVVALDNAPEPEASDELQRFIWWDPSSDLFEGLSALDAAITRRVL